MTDASGAATADQLPDLPTDPADGSRRSRLSRIHIPEEAGILAAFALIFVTLSLVTTTFSQPNSLLAVLRSISFFGIMALGMTFTQSLGEIDISVGAIFYLVGVVTSQLMVASVDPLLAAILGIGLGTLLGAANGAASLLLGVPLIIVSLGALPLYRGLGLIVSNARDTVVTDASSIFFELASHRLFGVLPTPAVVFLGLALMMHILLQRTHFGYRVQATGSNPKAARLAGIPVNRTRLQVAALLGATCGIAGVLFVGYFRAVDSSVGSGFELLVISAVVIGGTSILGGSGTIIGTVIGVLIIAEISSGIVHLGVPSTYSGFVTGAVILIAIALDRLVRRRQATRLAALRRKERGEQG
ncbi:MAG: ABC transporter permease [Chloroflexi bacterium]|nr:ABC transporter permease [Chloroflexota bacterium]